MVGADLVVQMPVDSLTPTILLDIFRISKLLFHLLIHFIRSLALLGYTEIYIEIKLRNST